jgi:glucokinase
VRLYGFLRSQHVATESRAVARAMSEGDAAAAITQAALEANDALANKTLDLFVRIYGAQAGNLALTAGATGGVYVAGGIAPKILSRLREGAFIKAFRNKANMSQYVAAIPVRVVLNDAVGLLGAALAASRL